MADAQKVDAARAIVARIHDDESSVVDFDGNGFCWGWGVIGSAHPHALQHGALVEAGRTSADVAVCATVQDLCLERCARHHVYESRSIDRYKDMVTAASYANTAENNFYTPGGNMLPAVMRTGSAGWCGSTPMTMFADLLGLDYLVIFEARINVNCNPLLIQGSQHSEAIDG